MVTNFNLLYVDADPEKFQETWLMGWLSIHCGRGSCGANADPAGPVGGGEG